MDYNDAQIEIALLKSVERQANKTAAALERVIRLMRTSARLSSANSTTTTKGTR